MTVSDSSRTAALPKRGKRAKPAQGIDADVAVLQQMTVDELRRRYAAVMGEPSRCRHKEHLIRKIAWRIQALAEGDLTERARRRAKELANDADVWYRRRRAPRYQHGSDPQGGCREVEVRTGSPLGTGHLKTAELRLAEAGCCRA